MSSKSKAAAPAAKANNMKQQNHNNKSQILHYKAAPVQRVYDTPHAHGSQPIVEWSKSGECRWTHTERFGSMLSSDTWAGVKYPINPGDQNIFPLLSGMAKLFDMYKFEHLEFLALPMTALTMAGNSEMAFQPNENDPVPEGPSSMAVLAPNYDIRQTNGTDGYVCINVDKKTLQRLPWYYVDTRDPEAEEEIEDNLYYLGNLITATEGNFDALVGIPNVDVGRLYVKYTCVFKQPRLRGPSEMSTVRAIFSNPAAVSFADPVSGSDEQVEGAVSVKVDRNPAGIPTGSKFRLGKPGYYRMEGQAVTGGTLPSAFAGHANITNAARGITELASELWTDPTVGNIIKRTVDFVWDGTPTGADLGDEPFGANVLGVAKGLFDGLLDVTNFFGSLAASPLATLASTAWEFLPSVLPLIGILFFLEKKKANPLNYHFYGIPGHKDARLHPFVDGREFTLEMLQSLAQSGQSDRRVTMIKRSSIRHYSQSPKPVVRLANQTSRPIQPLQQLKSNSSKGDSEYQML